MAFISTSNAKYYSSLKPTRFKLAYFAWEVNRDGIEKKPCTRIRQSRHGIGGHENTRHGLLRWQLARIDSWPDWRLRGGLHGLQGFVRQVGVFGKPRIKILCQQNAHHGDVQQGLGRIGCAFGNALFFKLTDGQQGKLKEGNFAPRTCNIFQFRPESIAKFFYILNQRACGFRGDFSQYMVIY